MIGVHTGAVNVLIEINICESDNDLYSNSLALQDKRNHLSEPCVSIFIQAFEAAKLRAGAQQGFGILSKENLTCSQVFLNKTLKPHSSRHMYCLTLNV